MESITIDKLVDEKGESINAKDLRFFLNNKLDELYEKDKNIPLLDYEEIRSAAMIDLIYEIMPSLRQDIDLNNNKKVNDPLIV